MKKIIFSIFAAALLLAPGPPSAFALDANAIDWATTALL
jgi:hypothetical protein